uniref:Putative secreted peptide n=1 Tax=Anopheles braziliensis TaxID=58242 RepID=A0A2M3ZXQ7_9DIPT
MRRLFCTLPFSWSLDEAEVTSCCGWACCDDEVAAPVNVSQMLSNASSVSLVTGREATSLNLMDLYFS